MTVDGRPRRWRWIRLHFPLIGEKNPERALRNLHALRDEFGESDFCDAYEGKFLLQAGDPAAARQAYVEAHRRTRERTDDVGRFVRYAAEGWLGIIDKNTGLAERCFARAREIPVGATFKAAILPPLKPDAFDQEFERWMRRKYPNE